MRTRDYITFVRSTEVPANSSFPTVTSPQEKKIPGGMALGGGTPANRSPHFPPCSPARCARLLSFSIDKILAPDFGRVTAAAQRRGKTPQLVAASPMLVDAAGGSRVKPGQAPSETASNVVDGSSKPKQCHTEPYSSSETQYRSVAADEEASTSFRLGLFRFANGSPEGSQGSEVTDTSIESSRELDSFSHDEVVNSDSATEETQTDINEKVSWPAWVYCTRYSDRPSSGPRNRRQRKGHSQGDEKRSRTAFTGGQLTRLRQEFLENRYLTEQRRIALSRELKLTESQVKIWFQNKRAKLKKSTGAKNPLAVQLMAQGLYNHSANK